MLKFIILVTLFTLEFVSSLREACKLPVLQGPCPEKLPRFAFNSTTQKCTPFIYGGCDVNSNKFETIEECRILCEYPARDCKLPIDSGPCGAEYARFGYHAVSGHCLKFQYGGCDGNGNNFESKLDCEKQCRD